MAQAAHRTAAAFSVHFGELEIQKQVLKPPAGGRQLSSLRAIVRYSISIDTIHLEDVTRRGIYVADVLDHCIAGVATHALPPILC